MFTAAGAREEWSHGNGRRAAPTARSRHQATFTGREEPIASPGENLTLAHYLRVLRRGWWIIAVTVVVTTATAVGLSLRQQHLYRASAAVLLSSSQNLASALSNVAVPSSDPQRVAATQASLARVPTVARRTLAALGLRDRTPEQFLDRSSVSASSTADLLTFSVTDPSRELATRLATAYAREYTSYRRQLDTGTLTRARQQVAKQLKLLASEGKRNSGLYDSLVEKDQQLATLQVLQTSNASVVRTADHASQVQPSTMRNGLLGLVLGLLLGVGLAFAREALDTRVRSAEELHERLGLPLLARLPEPPRRLRNEDRLVMLEAPEARDAEPFRILAVNVELANMERGARSIMITSALEGEGKSTTVANLAVALARSERKVIVADLDFRNPYLHRCFRVQHRPGITQVALGTATLDEALAPIPLRDLGSNDGGAHDVVHERPARGRLEVLTAGPAPPNAGEFAQSRALADILAQLVERADLVLVDAPPLLGVGDAVALSGQVDVLLVVSRLTVVRTPVVNELRGVLSRCLAPAIGLVATGTEPLAGYGSSRYAPALKEVERERTRPA